MSPVVSDSGPIHYLVLCGAIGVIPELYGRLILASAVLQELTRPRTPISVQTWIKALPAWATVRRAKQREAASALGAGESEAIALAIELNAGQLLVDDRVARRVATERGVLVTGTVGILEQAATRGFLNLNEVLQRLLQTNFRIDAEVITAALERDAARHKA